MQIATKKTHERTESGAAAGLTVLVLSIEASSSSQPKPIRCRFTLRLVGKTTWLLLLNRSARLTIG
jgi:hypothetical protein